MIAAPSTRQQPQNLDAEMAVLGAMLLDAEAADEAIEALTAEHLYSRANQIVFTAIAEMRDQQQAIDAVILRERLQSAGTLDKAGGAGYIMALFDAVPTSANVGYYIDIVRKAWLRRRIISVGRNMVSDAYDGDDIDDMLDKAEQDVLAINDGRGGELSMSDILAGLFDTIDAGGVGADAVPTGFYDLDDLVGGMRKSEFIVAAARPSIGKTSWCLNVALHVAIEHSTPVAVFSLEMGAERVAQNMLAMHARVDGARLGKGLISDTEWAAVTLSTGELTAAPVFVDDTTPLSIRELRARARRLHQRHNIGLVIVDYLQLLDAPDRRRDGRVGELGAVSRGLKALAKELRIPVLAAAQLNRGAEGDGDKPRKPRMSNLRESGPRRAPRHRRRDRGQGSQRPDRPDRAGLPSRDHAVRESIETSCIVAGNVAG